MHRGKILCFLFFIVITDNQYIRFCRGVQSCNVGECNLENWERETLHREEFCVFCDFIVIVDLCFNTIQNKNLQFVKISRGNRKNSFSLESLKNSINSNFTFLNIFKLLFIIYFI